MTDKKKYSIQDTPKKQLAEWFNLMTLGRALDEKAPNYLKQAIGWSYHAPYAGHDGIQLAIGQIFDRKTDHLFPYYRDMLTSISAGLTAEEIIFNGISKDNDVAGGGRHMSNHFAKPEWNVHNVSSCTGNHTLHAVGIARALKHYKGKGVAISSQGESSVSEGYVYEAINGASKEQLPVIFVFQDNGYGISVPKKDQTANRKVADNFKGLKYLKIFHCNGKDVFDSMNTMTEAKAYATENHMPAIVQANCVRMGAHSNSDKHVLYRDKAELSYVEKYDPMAKFRRLLIRYKRFTEEELVAIGRSAGGFPVSGASREVIDAVKDNNTYSLIVLGSLFLSKGHETSIRLTRELGLDLKDKLKASVIASEDLHSQFLFGKTQAFKLLGFTLATILIYWLVFTFQKPILNILGGDL